MHIHVDAKPTAEGLARAERQLERVRVMSNTCPTCKTPNALTRHEQARGYQCQSCTARDEAGAW